MKLKRERSLKNNKTSDVGWESRPLQIKRNTHKGRNTVKRSIFFRKDKDTCCMYLGCKIQYALG